MEVTHSRGYVYSIQYHIVWCVKYRHRILIPKIENKLVEILYHIANENNFQILECNTDKDHFCSNRIRKYRRTNKKIY